MFHNAPSRAPSRCAGCGTDRASKPLYVTVARFAVCGDKCSDKLHGRVRARKQHSRVSRVIADYERETGNVVA